MMYIPTAFDFVWCKFPFEQDLAPGKPVIPGEHGRPCMVFAVEEDAEKGMFVTVMYSTSNFNHAIEHPFCIRNNEFAEFHSAGLFKDTKFDAAHLARLPFSKAFFPTAPALPTRPAHDTCFLGTAHQRTRMKLKDALARLRNDPRAHKRLIDAVAMGYSKTRPDDRPRA